MAENQALELVKSNSTWIKRLLPDNTVAVDRFARSIQLYFDKNGATLANTTPRSKVESILFAAQLGLEPGYGNKIHFVAFKDTCVPIIGYNGYLELAERSGKVNGVVARIVYANDDFEIDYAQNPCFSHKPSLDADRGNIMGAYAVIYKKDGYDKFEWMPIEDINKIKATSRSRNKEGNIIGPWKDHFEEMCKKTVIRRAFKTEIISPLIEKAIELDNRTESGQSYRDIIDLPPGAVTEIDERPKLSTESMAAGTPQGNRGKPTAPVKAEPKQEPLKETEEISLDDDDPYKNFD